MRSKTSQKEKYIKGQPQPHNQIQLKHPEQHFHSKPPKPWSILISSFINNGISVRPMSGKLIEPFLYNVILSSRWTFFKQLIISWAFHEAQ